MTFNEFNRRLEKCHVDASTRYLLGYVFEQQSEYGKRLDEMLNILHKLAETIQNFTDLHEHTVNEVNRLRQGVAGVEVHSVRNEPEDG